MTTLFRTQMVEPWACGCDRYLGAKLCGDEGVEDPAEEFAIAHDALDVYAQSRRDQGG